MGRNNKNGKNGPKITTETLIAISKGLVNACRRHKLTLQDVETSPTFVLNIGSAKQLIHGIASAFKEIQDLDNWVFPKTEVAQTQPIVTTKARKARKARKGPLERLAEDSRPRPDNPDPTRLDLVVEDLLLLSTILEVKDVQALFRNTSLLSRFMPSQLQRRKY